MNRKKAYINQQRLTDIANRIQGLMRNCKDAATLDRLNSLYKITQNIPYVDTPDVVDLDVQISQDLNSLSSALQSGNKNLAGVLFDGIESRLTERSAKCYQSYVTPYTKADRKVYKAQMKENRRAQKRLARKLRKENGSVEEYRKKIADLIDKNAKLKDRCFNLYEELQQGYDATKDTDLKIYDGQMRTNAQLIDTYLAAIKRKSAQEFLDAREQVIKQTEKFAPITSEELIARSKRIQRHADEIEERDRVVTEVLEGKKFTQPSKATAAPEETYSAPASVPEGVYAGNPYAGTENPYGTPKAVHGKVEEYFDNVDAQVAILDRFIKDVGKAIEKKGADLTALSAEIKALLLQRKTASAAECALLDGNIDSKYSEYSTVKSGIERLNQERARYVLERNIISQIKDIRDASERNKAIEELSGGKFRDIAALAMAVNEDTERKNGIIAEARDAVAVANAKPIDDKTFAAAGINYDAGVKDEDKYAGLEKEFGIRT